MTLLTASKIVALICVSVFFVVLTGVVLDTPRQAEAMRETLDFLGMDAIDLLGEKVDAVQGDLSNQINKTRASLRLEIKDTRKDLIGLVDRRLDSLEGGLANEIDSIQRAVVGEAGLIQSDLNGQLTILNTTAATFADLVPPIKDTTQQIAKALPPFLDRDLNPEHNVYQHYERVSESVEKVMAAVAENAPEQQKALTSLEHSGARIADRLTKPTTWWKAALSKVLGLFRYNF